MQEDRFTGRSGGFVKAGRVLSDALGREPIGADEIFSAKHTPDIGRIEDVQWANLEGDGKIAIIRADHGEVHRAAAESGAGARRLLPFS